MREHGPLGSGEAYEHYIDEIEDSRTKRTVRTYLSKMTQYNLLKTAGRVGTESTPSWTFRQRHRTDRLYAERDTSVIDVP
jgi:hypothetical protein